MTTKEFTYKVRSVKNGVARLVAYYDKDFEQRPAAVLLRTDALPVGADIELSFVHQPADTKEIYGDVTNDY